MSVTASDWAKGIGYSIVASLIGGASKLAIRLSWLITNQEEEEESGEHHQQHHHHQQQPEGDDYEERHDGQQEDFRQYENFSSDAAYIQYEHDDDSSLLEEESSARPIVTSGIQEIVTRRLDHAISTTSSSRSNSDSNSDVPLFASSKKRKCLSRYCDSNNFNTTTISSHKTKRVAVALRCSGMIGMTILNPLFCVLAMNYASPSILAPFSGLTLVWIVLFSETLIGEKPSRTQIIAASSIVLGEVVVAVWGDHTNDENVTLDHVVQSYAKPSFDLYILLMILWITFLLYILLFQPSTSSSDTLKRFAWGVSGGSITGLQNFLKDSLTIIKACGTTGEPYPWFFYIFILLAILSSFTGLLFLTACMKRYDATFSSAMFVGSFVISASIMSAVHYDTFQNLESIWNWIMYLLGLMILMAGVKMLVSATTQQPLVQQEETATATAVDVAATGDTTDSTSTGGTNHPNRWTRSDELW